MFQKWKETIKHKTRNKYKSAVYRLLFFYGYYTKDNALLLHLYLAGYAHGIFDINTE